MSRQPVKTSLKIRPLSNWEKWRRDNPVVSGLAKGARVTDPASYFLRTHALTETLLRRALLVGLRKRSVRYSDAKQWLDTNESTPDRLRYPQTFDALFGPADNWAALAAPQSNFGQLWDLWLDFTKGLRNHLAHGVRSYAIDWLQCGTEIDQAFCIEFTASLYPVVGGAIGADLRKLTPRLGMGQAGVNIDQLMGRRARQPRPTLSLQSARSNFDNLGIN